MIKGGAEAKMPAFATIWRVAFYPFGLVLLFLASIYATLVLLSAAIVISLRQRWQQRRRT